MNLREYLQKHSNPCPHNQGRAHYQLIRDIRLRPNQIGIHRPVKTFREVQLYSGQIDLAALTEHELLFIIECKTTCPNRLGKNLQKARAQLRKAEAFFREKFETQPVSILAYTTENSRDIQHEYVSSQASPIAYQLSASSQA